MPQGKENHKSCKSDITSGHKTGSCSDSANHFYSAFGNRHLALHPEHDSHQKKYPARKRGRLFRPARPALEKSPAPGLRPEENVPESHGCRTAFFYLCRFYYYQPRSTGNYSWTAFWERTGFLPSRWEYSIRWLINAFEFLALAVLIACMVFLCRRNILKLRRFISHDLDGWPSSDANYILITEIILMTLFLTLNAADTLLQERNYGHYELHPTGNFMVSQWLHPLLTGLIRPPARNTRKMLLVAAYRRAFSLFSITCPIPNTCISCWHFPMRIMRGYGPKAGCAI